MWYWIENLEAYIPCGTPTPSPGLQAADLDTHSPPDMALGRHINLLPIVVICRSREEALKINTLNKEIVAQLRDPTNAREFARRIISSDFVRTQLMDVQPPDNLYYALRVAKQTGIYHEFTWCVHWRAGLAQGKTTYLLVH